MFLGIDCGTQGTKALLVDKEGRSLGRGYFKHPLIERESGAREQEPQWWIDALKHSVLQALDGSHNVPVVAIGVSGQQHGLVVLDEEFRVIRPAKLWNDTETAEENSALVEMLGGAAACIKRFGIVPLTGYTVSKLLWIQRREPANFERIRHILLPHEYLNFWLTGNMFAEYGDASGTGYFDVRRREWATEVLEKIDGGSHKLEKCLPAFKLPQESVGKLRREVAEELNLPANCVVAVGGGDNMMAAIGTGNVEQGRVTMSLGTSSTVYSFSSQPVIDNSGVIAPFCSSSGGWLPLVCTMNATNVVTQTLNLLGKEVSDIEEALRFTEPGAAGMVVLPFLNGERTPDLPRARGVVAGISSTNFNSFNFIRAVIEGVSFGLLRGLERILQGRTATVISLTGGGARSPQWRQLLADASGAVIEVPEEEEAGCLGAAIQAMYCDSHARGDHANFSTLTHRCVKFQTDSTTNPRPELRDAYGSALAKYVELLRREYPQSMQE